MRTVLIEIKNPKAIKPKPTGMIKNPAPFNPMANPQLSNSQMKSGAT